jgi:AcrR family transcriptional regulator
MSKRTNRRDLIIEEAAELFMAQGYNATSTRQIAEAAECTEAALYYHFKDGKRALFEAVVEENLPDLLGLLDKCREATSIFELVTSLGNIGAEGMRAYHRLQWIVAEYPKLSPDEQALVQNAFLTFHKELTRLFSAFRPDIARARELAWILICALFGFVHTVIRLDLLPVAGMTQTDFLVKVGEMMDS